MSKDRLLFYFFQTFFNYLFTERFSSYFYIYAFNFILEIISAFDFNLVCLILAGFVAGFINTIAGGGTLLTLPVLIFIGLPPSVANGTNRIAIFLQTLSGVAGYKSKGVTVWPFSLYCGVSALGGSLIGARIAIDIKGEMFNKILAIIMFAVVLLIIFKPRMKPQEIIEKTAGKTLLISIVAFFFLGIYGGFINAGIGFLIILFLAYVNNLNLIRANAAKLTIVSIYTLGAMVIFYFNDKINWKYGLIMSLGNIAGAWISSRWAVNKGNSVVRLFLVIMVIIMAVKLWFFN